ncbi:MAG: hypothetical protein LBB41_00445, partial [Prevotellaceae bacterium]|nr:hypothetical protein [Prevotellaceae bacterium]
MGVPLRVGLSAASPRGAPFRYATLRATAGFPLLSLTHGLIIPKYYITFLLDINELNRKTQQGGKGTAFFKIINTKRRRKAKSFFNANYRSITAIY